MPYVYDKHYETLEDIRREYNKPYAPRTFGGCHLQSRIDRENMAREREEFLKYLDFRDQMAARVISLDCVDLRNKYSILGAIKFLQEELKNLEQEEFRVPFNPATCDERFFDFLDNP